MEPAESESSLKDRIRRIPCMKDSYFYGICAGIAGGLGCFMFTSRIKRSTHVGFSSFVITTLSYWFYCRRYWEKEMENTRLMQALLSDRVLADGTVEPPVTVGHSV
ncbi:unnamed protein product [Nesidiocoris tenuis]|uniref:Cytochrome c oxidase assembly protein COX20, mitochondrial n=1 Tax=Nesidiocoris tenuis TaxID=355587 RepID=A0A6H5H9A1_9HEMI|nr:unnamed protein product [Nesidiocoris tenuis]